MSPQTVLLFFVVTSDSENSAYLNEMGITNRFFPKENAPNGNQELLARFKRTSDPEDQVDPVTGKSDIDVVAAFTTPLPVTVIARMMGIPRV